MERYNDYSPAPDTTPSTAWLEFKPSDELKSLLGSFLKENVLEIALKNMVLRTETEAYLNVLPATGGRIHVSKEERQISEYSPKIRDLSSAQFPLEPFIRARKDLAKGAIKFTFHATMNEAQMEAISSFENFDIDNTEKSLAVAAFLPARLLTADMHRQAQARDKMMKAIHQPPSKRWNLFVSDVRWAERDDLVLLPPPPKFEPPED